MLPTSHCDVLFVVCRAHWLHCTFTFSLPVMAACDDDELMLKVAEWLEWDRVFLDDGRILPIDECTVSVQNVQTRHEVDSLVLSNDVKTLRRLLCGRLGFGTAGSGGNFSHAVQMHLTVLMSAYIAVAFRSVLPN